jgi:hypothetical protein
MDVGLVKGEQAMDEESSGIGYLSLVGRREALCRLYLVVTGKDLKDRAVWERLVHQEETTPLEADIIDAFHAVLEYGRRWNHREDATGWTPSSSPGGR